jgi:hypothetical protein
MLQAKAAARFAVGVVGMIALLHVWHDAGASGALQLFVVLVTTGGAVALHLWIVRLFKDADTPAGGGPREGAAIAEFRALRRERRAAAMVSRRTRL